VSATTTTGCVGVGSTGATGTTALSSWAEAQRRCWSLWNCCRGWKNGALRQCNKHWLRKRPSDRSAGGSCRVMTSAQPDSTERSNNNSSTVVDTWWRSAQVQIIRCMAAAHKTQQLLLVVMSAVLVCARLWSMCRGSARQQAF
jgi:hypothetical protein